MQIDRCLQNVLERMPAATIALLVVTVLGGCQMLQTFESERRIRIAKAEHEACVERGYEFPGLAYTECRMDLHDKRLQERWMELQMSMEQQAAAEPGRLPRRSTETYRPLRLEDYRCEIRRDTGQEAWIDCFEVDEPTK